MGALTHLELVDEHRDLVVRADSKPQVDQRVGTLGTRSFDSRTPAPAAARGDTDHEAACGGRSGNQKCASRQFSHRVLRACDVSATRPRRSLASGLPVTRDDRLPLQVRSNPPRWAVRSSSRIPNPS